MIIFPGERCDRANSLDGLRIERVLCEGPRRTSFLHFLDHQHPQSTTAIDQARETETGKSFMAGSHQLFEYLTILEPASFHGSTIFPSRAMLTKMLEFYIIDPRHLEFLFVSLLPSSSLSVTTVINATTCLGSKTVSKFILWPRTCASRACTFANLPFLCAQYCGLFFSLNRLESDIPYPPKLPPWIL